MTLPIPTEDVESEILAQYCRARGLLFGHINSEIYTTSWKQKSRQTRLGTAKGMPDYLVVIPAERSKDGIGHLLAIELKRLKGGVLSESQLVWIDALNNLDSPNVLAGVARGAEVAIELIDSYLKEGGSNVF